MRHIPLFRTVRTEFLSFCIGTCRNAFPEDKLILVLQSGVDVDEFKDKVDGIITIPEGMLSPESVTPELLNGLDPSIPITAIIPLSNPRLSFYRNAYEAALSIGPEQILALSLDGRISNLTRFRFLMDVVLGSTPARVIASVLLLPYIFWLLLRSFFSTTGWPGISPATGERS